MKAVGDGDQEITYRLEAQPNFDAPFMGDNMGGGAKDLLACVRKEIMRRQNRYTLSPVPQGGGQVLVVPSQGVEGNGDTKRGSVTALR